MSTSALFRKLWFTSELRIKWFSTQPKLKLRDDIENGIVEEKIKPRRHPGIIKKKITCLPEWVVQAMDERFDDANRAEIYSERRKFANYLFSRRLPLEKHELNRKYYEIEANLLRKKINDESTIEEIEGMRQMIKGQVSHKLKENVFAWKPLSYTHYRSLLYMITRSAAEYSAIHRIFEEIRVRDPQFNPGTIFDFGSGVGSALWAANDHWKNIHEYLGVDISNNMLDLSEAIMTYSPKKIRALLYRQYFPVSNLKHELIVSAYSLMELSNTKSRLEILSKLWRKTSKYLVIVEQGTNAGFKEINEAKNFINHLSQRIDDKMDYFTFAPCPHDLTCPRDTEGKTPCNFLVHYQSLPLLGPSQPQEELYSYVVLKKDKRKEDDDWYRLVRPTLIRSKHVRCRFCTSKGNLDEVVVTPNYGKSFYACAKASSWGDRLPVHIISENNESNDSEEIKSNSIALNDDKNCDNLDNAVDSKREKETIFYSETPFSIKSDKNL